jgi:hypothetical protein
MSKRKCIRFTEEQLSRMEPAPGDGGLVICPACLQQHPLVYETEEPSSKSWGYVECDGEYVLAVVEGRVIGDTLLEIYEEFW